MQIDARAIMEQVVSGVLVCSIAFGASQLWTMQSSLAKIDQNLTGIGEVLHDMARRVEDHESRIRTIELRKHRNDRNNSRDDKK